MRYDGSILNTHGNLLITTPGAHSIYVRVHILVRNQRDLDWDVGPARTEYIASQEGLSTEASVS